VHLFVSQVITYQMGQKVNNWPEKNTYQWNDWNL